MLFRSRQCKPLLTSPVFEEHAAGVERTGNVSPVGICWTALCLCQQGQAHVILICSFTSSCLTSADDSHTSELNSTRWLTNHVINALTTDTYRTANLWLSRSRLRMLHCVSYTRCVIDVWSAVYMQGRWFQLYLDSCVRLLRSLAGRNR